MFAREVCFVIQLLQHVEKNDDIVRRPKVDLDSSAEPVLRQAVSVERRGHGFRGDLPEMLCKRDTPKPLNKRRPTLHGGGQKCRSGLRKSHSECPAGGGDWMNKGLTARRGVLAANFVPHFVPT